MFSEHPLRGRTKSTSPARTDAWSTEAGRHCYHPVSQLGSRGPVLTGALAGHEASGGWPAPKWALPVQPHRPGLLSGQDTRSPGPADTWGPSEAQTSCVPRPGGVRLGQRASRWAWRMGPAACQAWGRAAAEAPTCQPFISRISKPQQPLIRSPHPTPRAQAVNPLPRGLCGLEPEPEGPKQGSWSPAGCPGPDTRPSAPQPPICTGLLGALPPGLQRSCLL